MQVSSEITTQFRFEGAHQTVRLGPSGTSPDKAHMQGSHISFTGPALSGEVKICTLQSHAVTAIDKPLRYISQCLCVLKASAMADVQPA